MADRYWVGGTGTWNSSNTTNWSTSSGGTGGASVPTSVDDVYLDGNSGAGTITLSGTLACRTFDASAFAGTIANSGSGIWRVYGGFVLGSSLTWTASSGRSILLYASSGSFNIDTKNKNLLLTTFRVGNVASTTATWTLQSNFISNSGLSTFDYGTFNLNGYTYDTQNSNLGSITGTLIVGASTVYVASLTITSTSSANLGSGVFYISGNVSVSGAITNAASSTINMTGSSAKAFSGGGRAFGALNNAGSGTLTISGSNTFANITNSYSSTGATTVQFTSGTTNTFTAFNLTGQSGKVCTLTATGGTAATLAKTGSWYMGANSTDGGGNTGLIFTAGGGIDYLAVSNITGTLPATNGGNFMAFF